MAKKKVAVILSGSGVFDGAEIHETTMTLYAIMKQGGTYQIFAPDIMQHHVINHITGDEMDEKRNVMVEAARIARGKIKPTSEFDLAEFDAVMFPGGFGVAKNLSDFAFKADECDVIPEVDKIIKDTVEAKKPLGALCIAPAIVARVIEGAELTIGQDVGTAQALESMGAKHKTTNHGEVVVDKTNKIATTPCYMLDANILQIAEGAENVTKAIFEMME